MVFVFESLIEKIYSIENLILQRLNNPQQNTSVQSEATKSSKTAPVINKSKTKLPDEEFKLFENVNQASNPIAKRYTINNSYVENIIKQTKPEVSAFKEKVSSINNIISREINQIAAEKSKNVPKKDISKDSKNQIMKSSDQWESLNFD